MAVAKQKLIGRTLRTFVNKYTCLMLVVLTAVCMIVQRLQDPIGRDLAAGQSSAPTVAPVGALSLPAAGGASTSRKAELRQGGAGSNDVRLKGDCFGPTKPSQLPQEEMRKLHKKLLNETHAWGYFDEHEHHWLPFKGMRVLDVGMGQGPICVVAIETGVTSYHGLDPALCIDKKAITRHKKITHVAGRHSCKTILAGPECVNLGRQCPAYLNCWKTADMKYQLFPFTALEMMEAYPQNKVMILPGTFETLRGTDWLQKGMFDVATLWSVTEHLPNNRLVLEGIYRYLEPGKMLRISHHNFYSYDGHHENPKVPAEFDPENAAHLQLANWKHVQEGSFVHNKTSLNRVRLGDLMATVDVYFHCAWNAVPTKGALTVLTDKIFKPLEAKGYQMAELLVSRWHAACVRRQDPRNAPWLSQVVWHHPPLDGSYKAQPIPRKMYQYVVTEKKKTAEYTPEDHKELRKFLPAR